MEPITRGEMFLAAAAGEYSGELPEPITRQEQYLKKIIEEIDGGGSVSPEQIDAAIEDYLNSHDADIVTEAELTEALEGKADSADIPDVSGFIGTDVNNLTNYYDKGTIDTALAGKQATLTAGENITIADNNGNLTISATDTTYSAATTSAPGLMSAADKAKLDGIEAGAQVNTVTGVKGSNEADYRTGNISITKGNVGLGNVDNTADADKPISTAAQTALDGKVDKITGKGLSEANFTDAEKTKLAGIAAGADVSVQPDWNQGNDAADDYIKNKPSNLVQDASYVHTDNNFTNAEKAKADGAIQSTEKGTANGVAELDANGKVPTSQLPAYVDDVLSYNSLNDFPATGEDGKIYIAKDTNLSYRWTGSEYGVISPSLALGSTSSTAYRGDWGAQDRAAIGTLTDLQTSEKNNLVAAINEIKNVLTFDSTPTENSTNPVASGGVYTALSGKADATATQTALNAKQDALTAGDNVSIATVNGVPTISATDTTYPYKTNMIFNENYKTQFRTQTKGNAYAGGYISNIRVSGPGVDSAPQYGAGLAFGTNDTHGYINMSYGGDGFYVGGGTADKLNWTSRVYTTNYKPTKSDVGLGNVANLDQSSAIKNITRSGTTFTATRLDGTTFTFTQQDNNTTYSNATSSAAGLMSAADKEKLDSCKKVVVCASEAAYTALTKDPDTVYLILEATS